MMKIISSYTYNPYIMGPPVTGTAFYGRQEVLRFVGVPDSSAREGQTERGISVIRDTLANDSSIQLLGVSILAGIS